MADSSTTRPDHSVLSASSSPPGPDARHQLLVVRRVAALVGVDEHEVDRRVRRQRLQRLAGPVPGAARCGRRRRPRPRPRWAIAVYSSLTSQHSRSPAGRQTAGDADRRVPGERADLDRSAGADEAGEQRQQGALVGADLHPRGAAERARAVLQRRRASSGGAVCSAMYRAIAGGSRVGRCGSAATDRRYRDVAGRCVPRPRRPLVAARSPALAHSHRRDDVPVTATLYERVGGAPFFERLVDAFYDGVANDEVLLRLYPEAPDLTGARHRLTLFLIQYWGGPTTYSDERGHPRLRMRHMPLPHRPGGARPLAGPHGRRRRRSPRPSWASRRPRPSGPSCSATSCRPPSRCATTPGCPSPRPVGRFGAACRRSSRAT